MPETPKPDSTSLDVPVPSTEWKPTLRDILETVMDAAMYEAMMYSPTWGEEPLNMRNIRYLSNTTVQFNATQGDRTFVLTLVEVTS
jgi:hypothetical protein